MNIVCTGAAGQLGQCFQHIQDEFPEHQFTFTDRDELDITDSAQLDDFCRQIQVDLFINCAAYTAVDQAEDETQLAFQINEIAAQNLAEVALKHDIHLIHVSTDYVFHNELNRPLKADDPREAISVYGKSKLAGEKQIEESGCRYSIVRTSWLYSEFGHNFLKTMSRLISERSELSVVYDQIGTPTYAVDLARFIMHIISKQLHFTYPQDSINFSNSGVGSWYDFALHIRELLDTECNISPILTKDFPRPAERPPYSVFDLSKVISQYNFQPRWWQEAARDCFSELDC